MTDNPEQGTEYGISGRDAYLIHPSGPGIIHGRGRTPDKPGMFSLWPGIVGKPALEEYPIKPKKKGRLTVQKGINIQAADGKLLIGNHFHILEDESKPKYTTNDIKAFNQYVQDTGEADNFNIIFDESSCVAWPNVAARNSVPLAVCHLHKSAVLKFLLEHTKSSMSIDTFEELLALLLPYAVGEDIMALLSNIRDFHVNKVMNVERSKDNAGNFKFVVQRKAGNEDFKPPEKVKFSIPIFHLLDDDKAEIELDFQFNYKENGDEMRLIFILKSLTLEEQVFKGQKNIMEKYLAGYKQRYWGDLEIVEKDDSWKYKDNAYGGNELC